MRAHVISALLVTVAMTEAACGGARDARRDLNDLRHADVPYFYLGESFAGLPITHAEGDDDGAFVVYGDCTPPGGPDGGGCAPPVQVQTKVCGHRKAVVAIFFGEASDRLGANRIRRAVQAVRALNAAGRQTPRPAPSYDSMPPC